MNHLDRHHSWKNRTSDADFSAVTDKLEKHIHVKEQLRNNEVCTSINLLLQMLQVLLIRRAVRMTSWIAW